MYFIKYFFRACFAQFSSGLTFFFRAHETRSFRACLLILILRERERERVFIQEGNRAPVLEAARSRHWGGPVPFALSETVAPLTSWYPTPDHPMPDVCGVGAKYILGQSTQRPCTLTWMQAPPIALAWIVCAFRSPKVLGTCALT